MEESLLHLIRCALTPPSYSESKIKLRESEERSRRPDFPPGRFHETILELPAVLMCVTPSPVIALVAIIQDGDIHVCSATLFQIASVCAILIIVPLHLNTPNWIIECPVVGM